MDESSRASQLRRRAQHLRTLASAIEGLPVMHLDRYGDTDTWRGTRPDLCRATLAANQQQLHGAAEDLRTHAWHFERQADELDAIARLRLGQAS